MPPRLSFWLRFLCRLYLHRWVYSGQSSRCCARCGYAEVWDDEVSGMASGWRPE